jgi:hypothetical protein
LADANGNPVPNLPARASQWQAGQIEDKHFQVVMDSHWSLPRRMTEKARFVKVSKNGKRFFINLKIICQFFLNDLSYIYILR